MRRIWILTTVLLAGGEVAGATVEWSLQQEIRSDDETVTWTSPTPVDDGLPSHDFAYEITGVGIFYGGLLTPDDETDRYAAANTMTDSGTVGAFPTTLWTQSLGEPITDTSFDIQFEIDANGFGQAIFSQIALGMVLTDFGMNQIPIDRLLIDIDISVVGNVSPLGDYDNDTDVDADDYALWELTYGSTTLLVADGNGDNVVDAADYTIWRDNLTTPAVAISVPEPSVIWLAALAAGPLCRRRP